MIRVLLVDDHELVRRGLRELLHSSGDLEVVMEAEGVADAESRYATGSADVAVLDVRLGDGSGIELCRSLRDADPALRCLMLTSFSDDEALDASILAGAEGYVLKDVRGADLVSSIRRVASGGTLLEASVVVAARFRIRERAKDEAKIASLSVQERRILELLSEGLTNREVAERLFLAEKTVKNYVSNLLGKLGYSRRTEAALFAQRTLGEHAKDE
jgi:DNA-binding NarL/FixJ family response regulator